MHFDKKLGCLLVAWVMLMLNAVRRNAELIGPLFVSEV